MGVRVNQSMFRRQKQAAKERNQRRGDRPNYPQEEDKLILRDGERMFIRPIAGAYGPGEDEEALRFHRGWDPSLVRPFNSNDMGWFMVCNCADGTNLYHPDTRPDGGKCVPHFYETKEGQKKDPRKKRDYSFNAFPNYGLNILHYAKYHLVPRKGSENLDPGDKEYSGYVAMCRGKGCKHCEAGHPTRSWAHVHLQLDEQMWADFCEWNRIISRKCQNCDDGEILPIKAVCPTCKRTVNADLDQRIQMEVDEVMCPHCDNEVFMELEHDCCVRNHRTGVEDKGCDDPSYYDVWDCDLEIEQQPRGQRGKKLILHKHVAVGLDDEEMEAAAENPFEFESYVSWDPQVQADLLGVPNPYKE